MVPYSLSSLGPSLLYSAICLFMFYWYILGKGGWGAGFVSVCVYVIIAMSVHSGDMGGWAGGNDINL